MAERAGASGPRLPPILPIVDVGTIRSANGEPEDVDPGSLVGWIERLVAGGARWIEYRDKDASDRTAFERARALTTAGHRSQVKVLVNDRVDVAVAAGAQGVHLGQEDLPVVEARRLLGPVAIVGLSVDTVDEAISAAALPTDYVAIGPVFATPTKPDAGRVVGIGGVRAVRAAIDKPLVAIGGITPANASAVTAAGADCVAAVSSLLLAPDVTVATRQLLAAARAGIERC